MPGLYHLPPGVDFAAELVRGLRARMAARPPQDMARVTLYLNSGQTLKAVRAALDDGPALLLPRLRLIAELGSDAGAPPPAAPLARRLALAQLVAAALRGTGGGGGSVPALTASLAELMAEMQAEGLGPDALDRIDAADHAEHWQRALGFLRIAADFHLRAPEDREALQRLAAEALAADWQAGRNLPDGPVIVAGSTGSHGATRLFMDAVARLNEGAVILPGYDAHTPAALWDGLAWQQDHPQARLAPLIAAHGAPRPWTDAAAPDDARNRLVSLALRPAPVTDAWVAEGPTLGPLMPLAARMTLIEADQPAAEAAAVAALIRDRVQAGQAVTLIAGDRTLTRRVAAALDRWGIVPDDSAGIPLPLTAAGLFLRQIAALAGRPLTLDVLLTLLKHPLTGTGAGKDVRRAALLQTRELERHLREHGPAFPDAGALRAWGERPRKDGAPNPDRLAFAAWVARLIDLTLPLIAEAGPLPLSERTARHRRLAEAWAAGPGETEASELYREHAGAKARAVLDHLAEHAPDGPPLTAAEFAALLMELLQAQSVQPADPGHPLVRFRGPREARTESLGLVILGGLNEGGWPQPPAPDPWLSRPMRAQAGLTLPERRIGLSAHDWQIAMAAPEVVLTRARRNDEAETIPSRWLNRLLNLMNGLSAQGGEAAVRAMQARGKHWLDLAEALAAPAAPVPPAPRPAPVPPAGSLSELSVTAVRTLIRDPYAVYARGVLGLRPVAPLRPQPDAAERGTVLHAIIQDFLTPPPTAMDSPETLRARLMEAADRVLERDVPWPSTRMFWRARIARIAARLTANEHERLQESTPETVETRHSIRLPGLDFRLTARPDRIDTQADGRAVVYDYKSGKPPTDKQVAAFDKQLPLEAAMVERGAIGPAREVAALRYIQLGGDGETCERTWDDDRRADWTRFVRLIGGYLDGTHAFAARLAMERDSDASDYDHVARYGEWSPVDRAQRIAVGGPAAAPAPGDGAGPVADAAAVPRPCPGQSLTATDDAAPQDASPSATTDAPVNAGAMVQGATPVAPAPAAGAADTAAARPGAMPLAAGARGATTTATALPAGPPDPAAALQDGAAPPPPHEATRVQHEAADPHASTWLTANAGSGKTSVLTDRVARLLLAGTRPERILCLTYTKAAATEMQNRLLRRLGGWAMLDDAALAGALQGMGIDGQPDLAAARRLFAQAIETPGGLKVQTIHSFCASVLRRFPLEAGVPHGFAELDERTAANLRAEVVEEMARENAPEMADLVSLHSDAGLDGLLAGLRGHDQPPCERQLWTDCGLPEGFDERALLARCFDGGEATLVPALMAHLRDSGDKDRKAAEKLARGNWASAGLAELELLESVVLSGPSAKTPHAAKLGSFPTLDLQRGPCAALMDELNELMSRVEAARPHRLALAHARRTLALQRFAHGFCRRYAAAKRAGGWLDFDDLIARTADLLGRADMAQWVLFRLDGGIDHILVDEAQDTSPRQWQVIEGLTAEFTASDAAAAGRRPRTLFVVGDPKQSIYSFQGADMAEFERRRQLFRDAFGAAGQPMADRLLRHSFRSSPAVLGLVDATFEGERADGLGGPPAHVAYHEGRPGRVDLWPPFAEPDKPEPGDWSDPIDRPGQDAAAVRLARGIATAVAEMIGQPIVTRKGVRPIRAGDVLILVQRRSDIFHDLILALKQAGLPVAGADRLKLAGELAVRDIRAVLSVLSLPEDDLSLAATLRSPLFGLSEDDLFRLAAGRAGRQSLWERLRQSPHRAAMDLLSDLAGQADFLRPHDLISRLLVRHDGRRRLIARLGPEAQDGIDALLAQALSYEAAEIPSLTGFLAWLDQDDADIRRQAASAGEDGPDLVRVMTAHGSKGLESPIVILPDCAVRLPPRGGSTILPDSGPPEHWRGIKEQQPPMVADWVERDQLAQEQERRRLLYVALTRAESWLIVAAAGKTEAKEPSPFDSWHAMVAAGFDAASRLTENEIDTPAGPGRRLSWGDWPAAAAPAKADAAAPAVLPGWAEQPAPRVPRAPPPVAATGLGGDKVLDTAPSGAAGGAPGGREAAMLAGTRLHLLLEHLPQRPRAEWPDAARALLAGAEGGLPEAAALDALLDEVATLTDAEALAEVFAPLSGQTLREVALSAPLPGGRVLSGIVDRLIVAPDRITAIDYKSNAEVPDDGSGTPDGILRQLAAYRHALRLIWPDRPVRCAVLWTRAARLDVLEDGALDAAWTAALPAIDAPTPALCPGTGLDPDPAAP